MADPKEPFNEQGHAARARVAEKADRLREKQHEMQERLRPLRLARRIEELHKQERPAPGLDMLPRDRTAEIKRTAERDVARKEAGERNWLERAIASEMRKAGAEKSGPEPGSAKEALEGIGPGRPISRAGLREQGEKSDRGQGVSGERGQEADHREDYSPEELALFATQAPSGELAQEQGAEPHEVYGPDVMEAFNNAAEHPHDAGHDRDGDLSR